MKRKGHNDNKSHDIMHKSILEELVVKAEV